MKKESVTEVTVRNVAKKQNAATCILAAMASDAAKSKTFDVQGFVGALRREVDQAREHLVEFAQQLLKDDVNPLYAMSWSSDEFTAAATVKVAKGLIEYVETMQKHEEEKWRSPDAIYEEIHRELEREIRRSAGSPKRSTSVTSNLADEEELSARVKFVERMEHFQK